MRHPAARIFAWPVLIALAMLAGLALGLGGDGGWDGAACALLALPLIVLARVWIRRSRRRPTARNDPSIGRFST